MGWSLPQTAVTYLSPATHVRSMTTVRITDGLRYGFRFLGLSLSLVLVCGAALAGGGAFARTGFDAANPANSQLLQVAAGGLVALVGGLSLLGVTAGLLYKFVADSVATGVETAALEGSTAPVDGAAETTPDEAESTTDTGADADAVPADEDTADGGPVDADESSGASETPPDTASDGTAPETAEARARDVLEASRDATPGATSRRAETDVTAEAESTAGVPETGGDDPSAATVSEPSAGETRETATAAGDERERGDERGDTKEGAGGASADGPVWSEEPRGEELDRVVSEATEPDAAPSTATDPDAGRPAADPVPDADDGTVPETGSEDPELDLFSETDAPATPEAEPESPPDGSEPIDDGHGEASAEEDGFDPDFEDVEDTTDEPGDWAPLDEDDL